MYRECSKQSLGSWLALAGLLVVLSATPLGAGKQPPPAQRTYFTVFIGLTGPHSVEESCLEVQELHSAAWD